MFKDGRETSVGSVKKMEENKDYSEILPSWNLSDLYSGDDDPKIEADLQKGADLAKQFIANWREIVISGCYQAEQLAKAMADYEQINVLLTLPSAYADLRFAIESKNEAVGALSQHCSESISAIFTDLLFFELELGKISDDNWDKLKEAPSLAQYKHFIEDLRVRRNILSANLKKDC